MDYYGALNVTSAANASEIKTKYRRLALQYHPDKLLGLPKKEARRAEENFKIIAEGKEVLTNPTTRKEYDDVIAMLPTWARPKHGRQSVFDKEDVKFGVTTVLTGFFTLLAVGLSINQRVNQISDKGSIMRSRYFQQKFKAARKANKKMSAAEADYFDQFLREERIVFPQGWRYTFLGSVAALPWTLWRYPARRREMQARRAAKEEEAKRLAEEAEETAAKGKKSKGRDKADAEAKAEERRKQQARREAAEAEIKAARALQRRKDRLEAIRSRGTDALSQRAAALLEAAGLPVDPEEMVLAVEEEAHFARLFDEAMDEAEEGDRKERAAAQAAAEEAAARGESDGENVGGPTISKVDEEDAAEYDAMEDEELMQAQAEKAAKKAAAKATKAAAAEKAKEANRIVKAAKKKK